MQVQFTMVRINPLRAIMALTAAVNQYVLVIKVINVYIVANLLSCILRITHIHYKNPRY